MIIGIYHSNDPYVAIKSRSKMPFMQTMEIWFSRISIPCIVGNKDDKFEQWVNSKKFMHRNNSRISYQPFLHLLYIKNLKSFQDLYTSWIFIFGQNLKPLNMKVFERVNHLKLFKIHAIYTNNSQEVDYLLLVINYFLLQY